MNLDDNNGIASAAEISDSDIYTAISCDNGGLTGRNMTVINGADTAQINSSTGPGCVLKNYFKKMRGSEHSPPRVGAARYFLFSQWFASSMAVVHATAVMNITGTLYPPGGATALIAVIGSSQIHAPGYLYAVIPVGIGAVTMLSVAPEVNNDRSSRKYTEFWL